MLVVDVGNRLLRCLVLVDHRVRAGACSIAWDEQPLTWFVIRCLAKMSWKSPSTTSFMVS